MFLFDNNEIIKRLGKYPILMHFSESELRMLVEQSETLELETNQVLFYQDEPSDYVFYLIDGHLEGFSSSDFILKVIEIHRGEVIGEMGVVSGEPTSLAVRASVPSQVLKIKREVFLGFFKKDPELLMILTQRIARRLRNVILDLRTTHYPYKNIALVLLSKGIDLTDMKAVFAKYTSVDHVKIYEKEDWKKTKMDIVPFFYECEEDIGINIYIADYHEEQWSQAVLDHVDYIYLMVKDSESPTLNTEKIALLRNRPADIVIIHSEQGPYENTARFYEQYPFKRHHHVMKTKAHYQRLYRYMTGQAIGLVFSGGGLRGYVHYGLVKALLEANIPIDCIGGSSMGAALGGFLALHYDWDSFDKALHSLMNLFRDRRAYRYLTLPLVSLLSGELLTQLIKENFSPYQIEDLPTNFFCIVSNLSKIQKEIKTKGSLWEWIRASVSVPGAIPPFEKNGEIYVDGSVCANLPVQDMRDYLDQAGKIIAFNVHIHPFSRVSYSFPPILKFTDMVKYKLGLKKEYVLPHFNDILVEASFINQYMHKANEMKKADIVISPDTSSFNLHDAKNGGKLHMFAYELAKEKLREYEAIYARWLK
jgi:predicted acylesterase/phospholipase RssA/CRP-like cAMP-binding protein